jgi:GNAT superfamily N-acetyltransferase
LSTADHSDPPDAEPGDVRLAWDAAVDGWRQLAQLPSATNVFTWEQIRDADCFWWAGTPGAMAHQIFLTTPDDQVLQTLDQALASPNRTAGCDVVVRGIDSPAFAGALAQLQPVNVGTGPFLTRDLTTPHAALPPGPFSTSVLTTRAQQAEHLAMVSSVYRDVEGLTAFFQGAGASQLIGVYDQDRLIAAATIVRSGPIANIWSVATTPPARGQGAATTAVRTALTHATKSGATTASLGTTHGLVPWYQQLGFRTVGHERTATIRNPTR